MYLRCELARSAHHRSPRSGGPMRWQSSDIAARLVNGLAERIFSPLATLLLPWIAVGPYCPGRPAAAVAAAIAIQPEISAEIASVNILTLKE